MKGVKENETGGSFSCWREMGLGSEVLAPDGLEGCWER